MIPGENQGRVSSFKLMVSACAGMFVFGIVMAILGAILPFLFESIGFDKAEAGNLFLYMNFAMLIISLFFGPVVDRFGFKIFLVISSFLVALAFFILSRASSFALVMSAALILGLGGGGLNGATNALTNDIHPEKRSSALNLLGIFFGFGALSIPFLIGSLLKLLRLDSILLFATGLSLIPLILFSIFIFPKPKQPQGFPLKEASLVGRNPLLWLCAFLLFFQSGNEFTLGGWISTYFHERLGLTAMAASFVLAGYWAAIMFGRLGASQIVKRMKNEKLVLLSAILSFGSAFVLYISRSVALSCAGAVFVGLGFAAIYPTTLAVIGGNFAAFSGTAFSVTFGIALCGGMLSPWLTGKVAQASGMGRAMLIPLFNCLMIILIQSVIMSVLRKRPGSRVSG